MDRRVDSVLLASAVELRDAIFVDVVHVAIEDEGQNFFPCEFPLPLLLFCLSVEISSPPLFRL